MYTNEQLEAVSDFITALQFVASRHNVRMIQNTFFDGLGLYKSILRLESGLGEVRCCAIGAHMMLERSVPKRQLAYDAYQQCYGTDPSVDNDTHGWEYVRDRLMAILNEHKGLRMTWLYGGVGLGN
jgi:hypothetical protein